MKQNTTLEEIIVSETTFGATLGLAIPVMFFFGMTVMPFAFTDISMNTGLVLAFTAPALGILAAVELAFFTAN